MYDCGESDACVQEKEYCGNITVMVEEGESEKKDDRERRYREEKEENR